MLSPILINGSEAPAVLFVPPMPLFGERSPRWPAARAAHLKLHPACAVTGQTANVDVHHILPFHIRPDLELEPGNFITLAAGPLNIHFLLGHLLRWGSHNPDVVADCAWWRSKIAKRPGALWEMVEMPFAE